MAYQLAKIAIQTEDELGWIEEGPSSIHRMIVFDKDCNEYSDE